MKLGSIALIIFLLAPSSPCYSETTENLSSRSLEPSPERLQPLTHLCSQLLSLKEGGNLLLYHLDSRPQFTIDELAKLKLLFNRSLQKPTPLERFTDKKMKTKIDNPFAFTQTMTRAGDQIQLDRSHVRFMGQAPNLTDQDFLFDISAEVISRVVEVLNNLGVSESYWNSSIPLELMTYGIRYYLEPGEALPGVDWHKDKCKIQVLLVLRKPQGLQGGANGIRPLESVRMKLVDEGYSGVRILNPKNRLLIFDGDNLEHSVEEFYLPTKLTTHSRIKQRDIIGFCIRQQL